MDIREASEQDLLDALKDRGIDARTIREFSDTEMNNELTRRLNIAKQAYEQMIAQGLV